jgi:hypothetical protein
MIFWGLFILLLPVLLVILLLCFVRDLLSEVGRFVEIILICRAHKKLKATQNTD